MKSQCHLGLFAKFWQPGKVKTRLAAKIGDVTASEIYRDFLSHLLSGLRASADVRTVVFSPDENRADFARVCGEHWNLQPQSDGSLGVRLHRYFSNVLFPDGPRQSGKLPHRDAMERKVVVIGSDCPLIGTELIRQSFERLEDRSVIIGPSKDGGYYLIGMRGVCPDIFEGIEWSSDQVFTQTITRLQEQQVDYSVLEPMEDIDDWDDLTRLITRLEKDCRDHAGPPEVENLLERLQSILAGDALRNPK